MKKVNQINFILLLCKHPSIPRVTSLIYKSLPKELSEDTPQWYFLRHFRFGLSLCWGFGVLFGEVGPGRGDFYFKNSGFEGSNQ